MKRSKSSYELTGKAEQTRLRILHAAAKVIATQGPGLATTRMIAQHAGVANGLISRYFPKSENLFREVIRESAQEAYLSIEAPPEDTSGRQKLEHMYSENIDFFLKNPYYSSCFTLFYHYCSFDRGMRKLNLSLLDRSYSRIRAYLLQHARERGRNYSEDELERRCELLHDHLVMGLIRVCILEKPASRQTLIRRLIESIADVIE